MALGDDRFFQRAGPFPLTQVAQAAGAPATAFPPWR